MYCKRDPGIKTARTDVRMVYLGKKAHLGRCHGVLFGKEQFELENTICARIRGKQTQYDDDKTYSGTDCHLDLGLSHQNTSDCPRGGQQIFRVQGLPQVAPFPRDVGGRASAHEDGCVARVTHLDYPLQSC
jgi:hypothetical protein